LSLSKTDQSATDTDGGLADVRLADLAPRSDRAWRAEAVGVDQALPRSGPRDRGVRLGHVLLNRVKCDRFHRDGAMLPKILRSIGIYT
jgi:hypothetical protein